MNWKNMEKDLSDFLKTFEKNGIEFKNSYQAIIGFPSDGFRSDGMLAYKDISWVLVGFNIAIVVTVTPEDRPLRIILSHDLTKDNRPGIGI